jgi:hypothetical protein
MRLQNDPEIKALATDPPIAGLVADGNTFALMNHPRIRRIVNRISSDF